MTQESRNAPHLRTCDTLHTRMEGHWSSGVPPITQGIYIRNFGEITNVSYKCILKPPTVAVHCESQAW